MSRSPEAQAKIDYARERISDYLVKIEGCFSEPVRLTLVARNPAFPDGSRDMLLTNDDLTETKRALETLEQKGTDP